MKSLLKALLFVVLICVALPVIDKAIADDPQEEPVKPICTIDCSVDITSATYYELSGYFEFDIAWEIVGCTEGFESQIFIFLNSPSRQMCFPVMELFPDVPGAFGPINFGFFWSGLPEPLPGDTLEAIIWVKCNEHKTEKEDEDSEAITIEPL